MNVVKHSKAQLVTLSLRKENGLNQEIAFEDTSRPRKLDRNDPDVTYINLDDNPSAADLAEAADVDSGDKADELAQSNKAAIDDISASMGAMADSMSKMADAVKKLG